MEMKMKMKHIYYISCFHTNILHIKSSTIPRIRNKKNNMISYGETMYITENMIQEYLSRTIYMSIHIY